MNRLAALQSKLVLVVDDDPVQRCVERSLLEEHNMRVVEAANGEEGLRLAKELRPDLIMLDVVMPNMDGYAMCRKLRSDPRIAHTPVLMVTGLNCAESIEAAFEAGAGDFVTKPINTNLLPYRLLSLLRTSKLIDELRCEKSRAESASRAKSQFLAAVSHELRTPLNAIIGFSGLMKDEWLGALGNAKYCDYAEDIYNSGSHLLQLINDILDIAKIEAGKFEVYKERIDMSAALTECASLIRPIAQQAEIEITANIAPGIRVTTDERVLKQVVLNLLSNAIKFSNPGSRVSITTRRNADAVSLSIEDTGIGMSEEELELAKQPFLQVENELDRRYDGTGLGLPLSMSLTRSIGGNLEISSRPGEGTRVDVSIPIGAPDAMPTVERIDAA